MNKSTHALQYAFIVTGIIFGYQAINTLMLAIWSLGRWFNDGTVGNSQFFPRLTDYIFLAIQIAACWILVLRSDKVTDYVAKNVALSNGFRVKISPQALTQIVCIAIGIYFILHNLPRLLADLVNGFREKTGMLTEGPIYFEIPVLGSIIQVLLAILLVVASKQIAVFLARNIPQETITLEEEVAAIASNTNNNPE
jgi:hypothetical protein